MGPDSKIYIAKYLSGSLGVINDPEAAGTACNYVDNAIALNGATSYFGLSNFVTSYFLPTAISENSQPLIFSIYPNPFKDKATLTLPAVFFNPQSSIVNPQLFIFDITGNKIKQIPVTNQTSEIKKENLSAGIYFYQVISKNEILKGKLLIE